MPDTAYLALGLATLLVGGDVLVRGAAALAIALGIRPMLVGITVVAFGTSAPELAASITAALDGSAGLATGTVFGSNVANLALILGAAAALGGIPHARGSARFEVRCLLGLTLLTPLPLWLGQRLDRTGGALLVAFLVWFTVAMVRRELRQRSTRDPGTAPPPPRGGLPAQLAFVLAGLAALPLGASWLVTGASRMALALGVSEQVVGITVVAVGTSLPELVASVMAARRGHAEIALGNVLGSNLFNLTSVLGITALISPLPMTWRGEGPHIAAGVLITLLVTLLLATRGGISRAVGAGLLVLYAGYVALSLVLG